MKRRFATESLIEALADTPVVFVQGPRQCGKSTLVREQPDVARGRTYVTLDDATVLAGAQRDPDGFVAGLPRRVTIDEVQRVPELFRSIKRSVDDDRAAGRFLLTGSAQALVVPDAARSLVGRMEVVTLLPFSQGEMAGRRETFVDRCFASRVEFESHADSGFAALAPRLVRGGFPEANARANDARREAWFDAYVGTLIERDVRDLADIAGLRELPRLLRLLAARTSGLLNIASVSRDVARPQTTVSRYVALLQAVFAVRFVPAWHANLGLRLVKAPKVFIADSGIACRLLGLDTNRLRTDELSAGAVLESFVASELVKQSSWSETRPALFHFRTHDSREVDFVLEDRRGRLVGFEVKKTASPGANDFAGLRHLAEHVGDRFVRGVLLYTGRAVVPFAKNLTAVPVAAMWG